MKLIGTIIPFIGFRPHYLDDEGMPLLAETLDDPEPKSEWVSDCFEIEWFRLGMILFSTNVREAK